MTSGARTLLSFLLGLRTIMLIGSAGAIVGALLMFLQGARYLYHAWHDFFSGQQVVVPVLEAVDAFLMLCREEGILPALESSHAVAYAVKLAPKMKRDQSIVVTLSGRGDKDVETIAKFIGAKI